MAVFLNIVIRGLGSDSLSASLSSSVSSFSLARAILLRANSLHNHDLTHCNMWHNVHLFMVSPPAAPTVLALCRVGDPPPPLLTVHSYWPRVGSWSYRDRSLIKNYHVCRVWGAPSCCWGRWLPRPSPGCHASSSASPHCWHSGGVAGPWPGWGRSGSSRAEGLLQHNFHQFRGSEKFFFNKELFYWETQKSAIPYMLRLLNRVETEKRKICKQIESFKPVNSRSL